MAVSKCSMNSRLLLIALLLIIGRSPCSDAAEPTATDASLAEKAAAIAQQFGKAKDCLKRWDFSIEVLQKADSEVLNQLMLGENDSLALLAAWTILIRDFGVLTPEDAEDDPELYGGDQPLSFDPQRFQHFLGFIEGRFRVSVPEVWAENLQACKINDAGDLIAFGRDSPLFVLAETRTDKLLAASGTTLRDVKGGKEVAFSDGKTFFIPEEFYKHDASLDGIYAMRAPEDKVLVALPPSYHDYELLCFSMSSGELIWRTTVWADCIGGSSGIPLPNSVKLIIAGNRIYLFGNSGGAIAYLEGFDLQDGRPVLRFSTGY